MFTCDLYAVSADPETINSLTRVKSNVIELYTVYTQNADITIFCALATFTTRPFYFTLSYTHTWPTISDGQHYCREHPTSLHADSCRDAGSSWRRGNVFLPGPWTTNTSSDKGAADNDVSLAETRPKRGSAEAQCGMCAGDGTLGRRGDFVLCRDFDCLTLVSDIIVNVWLCLVMLAIN